MIIPRDLLPSDGRFGSGPSKVRVEAIQALAEAGPRYLGTSHRQDGVKSVVRHLREGLTELFSLPAGYEVVLGNGGSTAFWDALAFGLVEARSHHYVFGEFSSKCAAAVRAAPHLKDPGVAESPPGTHPGLADHGDADLIAMTHNETSTGVMMPVSRPIGDALVTVDATSAAGGMLVDPADFDVYYFAPQKCFAGDGGLWIALCSPAGVSRIDAIEASGRYVPASLNLKSALDNSRKDQTSNTPGLATLFLMVHQVEWMLAGGGLGWAAGRSARSASTLYGWAESSDFASPFVSSPAQRSPVVGTIDLDEAVDAKAISSALRANGIVDTEPYRKLGRNQLRIAMYPAIDPDDVAQLTRCIDFLVEETS